jgi:hypothetical protein
VMPKNLQKCVLALAMVLDGALYGERLSILSFRRFFFFWISNDILKKRRGAQP